MEPTLRQAVDLIKDPTRHTTKANARTIAGVPVSPFKPEAHSFDLVGAVQLTFRHSMAREAEVLKLLTDELGHLNSLNDLLDHDLLIYKLERFLDAHPC